jgi:NADPH2:quinone reductase
MRAIVYYDYGPPDRLVADVRPRPRATRGKALIQVAAAGINPIDARLREGQMRGLLPGGFPRIPGYDVAGVIIEAPSGSELSPGDRVLAFLQSYYGGGYAEYAACRPAGIAVIPDEMTMEEAAALPLAGCTALQGLRDLGQLQTGQSVLINGASGGVGCFAVQIAAAAGAQITAVASGSKEGFVRELGASSFIDYQQVELTKSVQRWDLIFDVAGKLSFKQARPLLQPRGRFISTEPSFRSLLIRGWTAWQAQKGKAFLAKSKRADLEELVRLYRNKTLQVVLDQVYPLSEAAAAHRHLEKGVDRGKLVLNCRQPQG